MIYKQCRLSRGRRHQYSWIPSRYAKKGKYLRIRDENGWLVDQVHGSETEERLKQRERGYKRWRSVTDV